jgi:hypothetical protein
MIRALSGAPTISRAPNLPLGAASMRLAVRLLAFLLLFAAPLEASPVRAETANGGGTKTDEQKSGEKKPEKSEEKKEAQRPFVIVVMGDSLADGIWGSLYRGYVRQQKLVRVSRYAINSAGFTAHNFETDYESVANKEKSVDLVVFMVGANDRQRVFEAGNYKQWAQFRTDKWFLLYRHNIRRFLAMMQAKKVQIVWVGLPIMRRDEANEDAKMMNGIYRELAAAHGATFVDIWTATANKDGEYDPFIEDEKGRKRRFRHDDGVHFTDYGYDVVMRHVMKVAREKLPQFQALWSVPGP